MAINTDPQQNSMQQARNSGELIPDMRCHYQCTPFKVQGSMWKRTQNDRRGQRG